MGDRPGWRRSPGAMVPWLVGGALLVGMLSGCGPASDKSEKPSATNVTRVAPRSAGKTNAPALIRSATRTNVPPGAGRTAVKAPAPGAKGLTAAKTNAAAAVARAGAGTNAAPTASVKARVTETLRTWQASRAFYPAVGVICLFLCVAGVLALRRLKAKAAKTEQAVQVGAAPKLAVGPARRKAGKMNVHSCNVLQVGAQTQQLWQFDSRGRGFVLNREQSSHAGERLPAKLVAKDWRSLWQRKLNIAWLPPERVFLRVAQFPASDFDETVAMVELQLEKLSPMPVAQIVWSIQVLRQAEGNLQTVIVMIIARSEVEEFLGRLEGQGFLADRLELPLLDQLQATAIINDGAWIYPEASGGGNAALVAWWYGGVLQNLALITLPPANRPESLREQLLQMAWAGEMEGWLTAPPTWHLVADTPTAAEWEPALQTGLEQPIQSSAPVSATGLAALTATRAAQAGPQANLLPAEFSTRYHQQFVDRLWMGGLGAVVGLYLLGVLVYFGRLQVELYRTRVVEQKVAELGATYTNAIQLRDKFKVLKERQELKYAALDCWKTVAELLPDGVTLEGYTFSGGKKLTLNGSAPDGHQKRLLDFDADIRKAVVNGQPLFDPRAGDRLTYRSGAVGGPVSWSCVLELKRSEAL